MSTLNWCFCEMYFDILINKKYSTGQSGWWLIPATKANSISKYTRISDSAIWCWDKTWGEQSMKQSHRLY